MRVEAWLPRAARIAGEATAVEADGRAISYRELLAAAQAGAQALAARGIAAGEAVAIELPPGVAFVQALHAVWLAGAAALPLDMRMTAAERDALCDGVALRVADPLPGAGRAADAADAHTQPRPQELARPQPPKNKNQTQSSPLSQPQHALDATALLLHTSGTTAAPKRVEITFGNLLYGALGSAVALGADPHERWLCTLPLCHVGGLSILARSAIFATTAVVHERFETQRALTALMDERITVVSVVATTLARLLDAGLRHPPALRLALAGGGPVPPALLTRAQAAGVTVCQTYGLTESSAQACTVPLAAARAAAPAIDALGAGRPLFCTTLEIAPDGEILLAGPTIAASALATQPDSRLHTGDLGRIDARGNLHVTGRKADTIVSGGENVAPAEVEAVLHAHPEVREAAVIARSHPDWGEAVTAIVVPAAGSRPDPTDLRAHCAAALAPYKVPKQFVLSDRPLPRTRSGKLLRRELS